MAVAVAEGQSIAEAGRLAGYQDRSGPYQAMRQIREKIIPLMEEEGLGIKAILQRLRGKLDATRIEVASYKGIITDALEVPDHATQLRAVELSMSIMGLTQREAAGATSIGTVNILVGDMPKWAGPGVAAEPNAADAAITTPLESTVQSTVPVTVQSDIDTTPPEVHLKVLTRPPGAYAHTHSTTDDATKIDVDVERDCDSGTPLTVSDRIRRNRERLRGAR